MGMIRNLFGKKTTEDTDLKEESSVPEAKQKKPEAEVLPMAKTAEETIVPSREQANAEAGSQSGEYAVRLIRCGQEKVNLIKWTRRLTGCSLPEAKEIIASNGMIGFVRGKEEALRWYYRFAQGDSSVEFTKNFIRLKPYGVFCVEAINTEMGKTKFKTWEDNVGYMYGQTICDLLQDKGYTARVVKKEHEGESEVSVVTPNLFRKADFNLIGGILKDIIGMNSEEFNALLESEDGIVRGLNEETAEYIKEALSLARGEESKEYKAVRVIPKAENLVWKIMCARDEVYIPSESLKADSLKPWLFPDGRPAVMLDKDEAFCLTMDPYAAEGDIVLRTVAKDSLRPYLKELAGRGQTDLQVVYEGNGVLVDLNHFLPSPDSEPEYLGRQVRRKITEFLCCLRRYEVMLPKRERRTDRGDMVFCMAVNTKMNLMRAVGRSVFYTIADTTEKKDKITLYTQNAWNIVQQVSQQEGEEIRSFCAPDDLDAAIIPAVSSFYNYIYKKEKTCVPLFTTAQGARKLKESLFTEDPRANVTIVTFDDVKEAASLFDGLLIDPYDVNFFVEHKAFEDIESMRNNILELPVAFRFRNSGNPPQKKEPVFTIEEIRKIADEKQESRIGCRSAVYDSAAEKWRMKTQLDESRIWFLSVFVSRDGKVEKYALDYEGASDSHYEFIDEAGIRKKLYEAGDEYMYLDQIFARYVMKNGGEALLRMVYPFLTAQFHYD